MWHRSAEVPPDELVKLCIPHYCTFFFSRYLTRLTLGVTSCALTAGVLGGAC